MLNQQRAIDLAQDGKPHSFKFVAKGTEGKNRKGGYIVSMENAVVTSSNFERRKMNIKCLDSAQIRMCYFILLIEFDGHEIFV